MSRICRIRVATNGTRSTVTLLGPLAAGRGSRALPRRVRALLDAGARDVILDLSGVPFTDCAGLGVLARCLDEARRRGADLRVRRPRKALRRMLLLSGLLEPLQGRPALRNLPSWCGGRDAPAPLYA